MAASADSLLDHLYRLAAPAALRATSDRELLAAFVANRHPAAFNAMVGRHGPMVLNVCRRMLGDAHLAEDAFQATFLVLAKKPRCAVRPGKSLAAWLSYGVAYRMALNAAAPGRQTQAAVPTHASRRHDSRSAARPAGGLDGPRVVDAKVEPEIQLPCPQRARCRWHCAAWTASR